MDDLAAAAFVVVWQPLVTLGDETRLRREFERHRGRYEAIVAGLGTGPPWTKASGGRAGSGTSSSPVLPAGRVPVAGRDLDNWCGVVFDPRAWSWRRGGSGPTCPTSTTRRSGMSGRLFGATCGCKPLGGDWYYCCFT
ncbi:MAG: hypothetical protein WKF75_03110 [Singulisphaera sp.]